MADKELNPSPKFPQGTYPQLSPNPKFENGLVNKTGEKPNGSEQTNPQEKPTVLNGEVYVNGSLKVNGKEVVTDESELPPTDTAQEGDVLQLNSQKKPVWGTVKFEDIVDKDGHKRFVEGNITIETITGVTQTYGKWSLSGSHLLIVVSGSIADTTEIANGAYIAKITLPAWFLNKIVTTWGNRFIEVKSFSIYNDDFSAQTIAIGIEKFDNLLSLRNIGNFTATKQRGYRFAFDLLIDNEEQE